MDNLAIIGRNAVELLKILPGAQNSGGWNGVNTGEVTSFNGGAGAYTVNGTRFDQMAVVSDGGNVVDSGFNGGAMVTPNVEMIQLLGGESERPDCDGNRDQVRYQRLPWRSLLHDS